ncbi:MAG: peptidase M50 [Ruminococcus sp.]|nr:peptidase M50 [Ruminococcus sp.]
MLRFRLGGVSIRIYFGFFAMLTFYFYLYGRDSGAVGAALTCCLLHETGHLAAMLLLGFRPKAVCFYAGGIKLVPKSGVVPRPQQTVILAAGCTVNLLLAAVSGTVGLHELMCVSLAVGLINLLPLKALDGGRLMALYLPEKARVVTAAATVLPLCAAAFAVSPPSALFLAAFAAAAELLM